jgi:hypothetical protein
MSNIFYSNVDANLQKELNARGKAGKGDRSNAALDFMLGKIANVTITAYTGNSSKTPKKEPFSVLGGTTTRQGRFLPNGSASGSGFIDGFLTPSEYTKTSFIFDSKENKVAPKSTKFIDDSRRTGPYITQVDVSIGDHSMGLLNKATVALSIPNVFRDLEDVEDTWFRPGRFVSIEIEHPRSAIITANDYNINQETTTNGLLTSGSLPNEKALQERYKDTGWDLDDLKQEIRRMNKFRFEGLITSFDFSYTDAGTIDATISLTGTSNVFTDISMFMPPATKQTDVKKQQTDIGINPNYNTEKLQEQSNTKDDLPPKSEFFNDLESIIKSSISKFNPDNAGSGIIRFENLAGEQAVTDHFILYGQPYRPDLNDAAIKNFLEQEKTSRSSLTGSAAVTQSLQLATRISENDQSETNVSFYHRYITLGSLISFTNQFITSKVSGSVEFPRILCDDLTAFSNYLPNLTSCIPNEILFLPADPNQENGMNHYGDLAYYGDIKTVDGSTWPGVHSQTTNNTDPVIYPSRIFINIEFIQKVLNDLSATNTRNFTLKNFLATISARIAYASGDSIDLKLRTDPDFLNKMYFSDTKYIKTSKTGQVTRVEPYSVPMLANHPNGTVVREFQFKARLPESVKNLSYVLNSGNEVTEEQIAPYMNFMYNSKDEVAINKAISKYKNNHENVLKTLSETRKNLSLSPNEPEFIGALNRALKSYIKFPTDDITKSQQITAPLFPFEVEFTIDGINGLRYGDVLTFDGLPLRYRVHTVFSIISITHNVTTDGDWTTNVRCIMRPSIE